MELNAKINKKMKAIQLSETDPEVFKFVNPSLKEGSHHVCVVQAMIDRPKKMLMP